MDQDRRERSWPVYKVITVTVHPYIAHPYGDTPGQKLAPIEAQTFIDIDVCVLCGTCVCVCG